LAFSPFWIQAKICKNGKNKFRGEINDADLKRGWESGKGQNMKGI